jgi:hypothetical protein
MNRKGSFKKVYAYTPGLKVKRCIVIRKMRLLPLPGEVLVREGEEVDFHTIIARTYAPGDPEIIPVAAKLGVSKQSLPLYLKKKKGERVREGELIGENRIFFGLIKKRVYAPFDGTIESISDITGRVIIRSDPIPVEVDAYIPGKVVKVIPREGAVIETRGSFIQGIFGIGGETFGDIHIVVDSPKETLTPDMIEPEHKGKILVGGSCVSAETLRRAAELGVSGIVVGGIKSPDLREFLGYDIGVAITGEEECGLTLIVTESFGEMPMARHTFDLLTELEGRRASICGATQIRAGVLRPEIIVPNPGFEIDFDTEAELEAGMMPGTRVRAIRAPYFGKLGIVVGLPPGLQRIETESMVRVVEIQFDDGERAILPRANVEIIVE